MTETILQAETVSRRFGGGRRLFGGEKPAVQAVRSLSLSVMKGETLGVVGESGCGKSTLARMLVGLDRPSGGRILLDGQDTAELSRHRLAGRVQYVFQDPLSSLNPRKTIRQSLEAPLKHLLKLPAAQRKARIEEVMGAVGLRREFLERYPHEFSGGQAQRIGIARALAAEPEVLVLDEPVSALDVSVQAQVLQLLADLKTRLGLTYVFISHDLAVVEAISDRLAVMYFGSLVEEADAKSLFQEPRHPYTALLFKAAPIPGRRRPQIEEENAELPDPLQPPLGCPFAARCPRATETCLSGPPPLARTGGRALACFHPLGGA